MSATKFSFGDMGPPAASQRRPTIHVFWDYENIKIPAGVDALFACDCIRRVVEGFGNIVSRRLYYDSRKLSEAGLPRGDLDLAGFTLVDCPTRNQKETLDKKIIVDVMHEAMLEVSHGGHPTIVLISSDGDFAYMLQRLRDVGVNVMVIHQQLTRTLLHSANVAIHWRTQVLNFETTHGGAGEYPPPPLAAAAEGYGGGAPAAVEPLPGLPPPAVRTTSVEAIAELLDRDSVGDGSFDNFLVHVDTTQSSSRTGWASEAQVCNLMYRSLGTANKGMYAALAASAVELGLVEFGRRLKEAAPDGSVVLPVPSRDSSSMSDDAKRMTHATLYVRLTESGKDRLAANYEGDSVVSA